MFLRESKIVYVCSAWLEIFCVFDVFVQERETVWSMMWGLFKRGREFVFVTVFRKRELYEFLFSSQRERGRV